VKATSLNIVGSGRALKMEESLGVTEAAAAAAPCCEEDGSASGRVIVAKRPCCFVSQFVILRRWLMYETAGECQLRRAFELSEDAVSQELTMGDAPRRSKAELLPCVPEPCS
jgi:hypothetical protein